jgi:hypothetical protein
MARPRRQGKRSGENRDGSDYSLGRGQAGRYVWDDHDLR